MSLPRKTAASEYLRKEDICFSRTAVTREGSGATGASASHGENWCMGRHSCTGFFSHLLPLQGRRLPKDYPCSEQSRGQMCKSVINTLGTGRSCKSLCSLHMLMEEEGRWVRIWSCPVSCDPKRVARRRQGKERSICFPGRK